MSIELFKDENHLCLKFDNFFQGTEVPCNQFLLVNDKWGVLIDPGGNRLFSQLTAEISSYCPPQRLKYIILSHQDPDVGAGLNGWLLITDAVIAVSDLWVRFIPNFCMSDLPEERVLGVPDQGTELEFGNATLQLVPAHFLHSPGNFHVFDKKSGILFTSDLGASIGPEKENITSRGEFEQHVAYMSGFHKRYIPHSSACKRWAATARTLPIKMIVPQHGARFTGEEAVSAFIDWVDQLEGALG